MILCLIRIYFQPAASLVPTSHAPRPCRAWQPEKQGEEGDRKGGMRGGRGLWTLEDFPAQRGERCPLPWAAGSNPKRSTVGQDRRLLSFLPCMGPYSGAPFCPPASIYSPFLLPVGGCLRKMQMSSFRKWETFLPTQGEGQ